MKWTLELAIDAASNCNTKQEFRKLFRGAENYLYKHNLYNNYTSHFINIRKIPKIWDYNSLKKLASKYNTKKEFRLNHDGAYQMAIKKNYIDDICSHMKPLNSKKHRDVYAIIAKDFSMVYIGLSCNVNKRYLLHLKKPSKRVKVLINLPHKLIILKKHITTKDAIYYEDLYIKVFANRNYIIANSVKSGSIGLPAEIKWTKEKVHEKALLFNKSIDFCKAYPGAYDAAQRNKWLDDVTSHINKPNKAKKYNINNVLLTVTEIATLANLPRTTISKRISRGILGSRLLINKKNN